MRLNPNTIPAYLRTHADLRPEGWPAPKPVEYVLVVPMRGEGHSITPLLESIEATQGAKAVLLIAVVNGSENGFDIHDRDNDETIELLQRTFSIPKIDARGPYALGASGKTQLLLVNRATPGLRLPENQGVGLARKIGCDLALELHMQGLIESTWIHSSDADVVLPSDYFTAATEAAVNPGIRTLTYPFTHIAEGTVAQRQAIRLYEISLYYYVSGLKWAGSPYAYQTIGSTLAFQGWNYAAVRGFPRREAGEDFYLLNKLAKTGRVSTPTSKPIEIRGRFSNRVPFGTGAAMNEMAQPSTDLLTFPFYDPAVFCALKATIEALRSFSATRSTQDFWARIAAGTGFPLNTAKAVIQQMKFSKALTEAVRQSPTEEALGARLSTWFDSFKTLRFIHQLRDMNIPSVPWHEALHNSPFLENAHITPATDETNLENLRVLLSSRS